MRTAVFPEEDDRENCDVIPGLIQWWGEKFEIEKAPAAAEGAYVLRLTLATKNSPDHDYTDSAIMTAVGHRLKYYYSSECLGCGDYRTNDEEGLFFTDRVRDTRNRSARYRMPLSTRERCSEGSSPL